MGFCGAICDSHYDIEMGQLHTTILQKCLYRSISLPRRDADRAAPLPTFAHVKNQTKPFGTDDGFDGEGRACGTSIVRVARQMVSGKSLSRGFTVAK